MLPAPRGGTIVLPISSPSGEPSYQTTVVSSESRVPRLATRAMRITDEAEAVWLQPVSIDRSGNTALPDIRYSWKRDPGKASRPANGLAEFDQGRRGRKHFFTGVRLFEYGTP